MKILRIILYALLGIIGLVLLLGLIAPKEASTSRSAVIDAPQQVVFNTVNDFKTWEDWSPWKERDKTMVITYGDQTVGKGANYSWESEDSGTGNMQIVESDPSSSIKTEIEFDGQGKADGSWSFEPAEEGGTKVSWGMYTKFPFPFNAMLLFQDFEGAINKDFDRGLELLKQKIEEESSRQLSGQTIDGFDIKVVDLPIHHFVAIQETIPLDKVGEHYQKNLPKVHKAVTDSKIAMAGMPCGLFYSWDEEKGETNVAQAIPVQSSLKLDGFQTLEVPESKALLIEYYGDYSGTGAAHMAMEKYINMTGAEAAIPAIEEYVTDPSEEPNPEKWLTRIYYPMK